MANGDCRGDLCLQFRRGVLTMIRPMTLWLQRQKGFELAFVILNVAVMLMGFHKNSNVMDVRDGTSLESLNLVSK